MSKDPGTGEVVMPTAENMTRPDDPKVVEYHYRPLRYEEPFLDDDTIAAVVVSTF